jgi:TolA-binding protein
MMQEVRSLAHDPKKKSVPSGKPGGHPSASTGPAYQHYQAAVQLIQQGKFDRALAAFEKLLPAAPPELLERCKMYISTCQRQL